MEGSFRVLQGGLERGTVQAGADTVTLTEPGPVVLEPIPETFPAGWDGLVQGLGYTPIANHGLTGN